MIRAKILLSIAVVTATSSTVLFPMNPKEIFACNKFESLDRSPEEWFGEQTAWEQPKATKSLEEFIVHGYEKKTQSSSRGRKKRKRSPMENNPRKRRKVLETPNCSPKECFEQLPLKTLLQQKLDTHSEQQKKLYKLMSDSKPSEIALIAWRLLFGKQTGEINGNPLPKKKEAMHGLKLNNAAYTGVWNIVNWCMGQPEEETPAPDLDPHEIPLPCEKLKHPDLDDDTLESPHLFGDGSIPEHMLLSGDNNRDQKDQFHLGNTMVF